MLSMFRKKIAGQSIIEYVALIIITMASLTAMFMYISRVIEIRQRHLNQELNESSRGNGQI